MESHYHSPHILRFIEAVIANVLLFRSNERKRNESTTKQQTVQQESSHPKRNKSVVYTYSRSRECCIVLYQFEMKRHELTLEQKISFSNINHDFSVHSVRELTEKHVISESIASTYIRSKRLLQAHGEIHRLKLKLTSLTSAHNQHLPQSTFLDPHISTRTNPTPSSHVPSHSAHSFVTPKSLSAYLCTSTFQPNTNTFTAMTPSPPLQTFVHPHPLSSRAPFINSVTLISSNAPNVPT